MYTHHIHIPTGRILYENALLVNNMQILERLRLFRILNRSQDVCNQNNHKINPLSSNTSKFSRRRHQHSP